MQVCASVLDWGKILSQAVGFFSTKMSSTFYTKHPYSLWTVLCLEIIKVFMVGGLM